MAVDPKEGEAVDDTGILACSPIKRLEDVEGRALRSLARACKSTNGQQFHLWRDAHQFAMRRNRAGHGSAVRVRRCRSTNDIILIGNYTGEIGVGRIDF
ncbi:MAG TPA: hypothetical protein VEH02_07375 [Pseudolabrys sp.]|nr:hypothetical protein [Pseudolabrys sp.]